MCLKNVVRKPYRCEDMAGSGLIVDVSSSERTLHHVVNGCIYDTHSVLMVNLHAGISGSLWYKCG